MFATSFVLGYHGCDEKIGEKILTGAEHVSRSSNDYDWLGAGAYFWENSPERALSWADYLRKHPTSRTHGIDRPFVVGAIIDLGNCLDLSDAGSLTIVRNAYEEFQTVTESAGAELPVTKPRMMRTLTW